MNDNANLNQQRKDSDRKQAEATIETLAASLKWKYLREGAAPLVPFHAILVYPMSMEEEEEAANSQALVPALDVEKAESKSEAEIAPRGPSALLVDAILGVCSKPLHPLSCLTGPVSKIRNPKVEVLLVITPSIFGVSSRDLYRTLEN